MVKPYVPPMRRCAISPKHIRIAVDETWHRGPPPSIGWWPASVNRADDAFRWWNGKHWSIAAFRSDSASNAPTAAYSRATWQKSVEWRHRPHSWPERSFT